MATYTGGENIVNTDNFTAQIVDTSTTTVAYTCPAGRWAKVKIHQINFSFGSGANAFNCRHYFNGGASSYDLIDNTLRSNNSSTSITPYTYEVVDIGTPANDIKITRSAFYDEVILESGDEIRIQINAPGVLSGNSNSVSGTVREYANP